MHWADWAILGGMALVVLVIGFRSRKYTQSVADFLAAGRCARRYLLTVTAGAAGHAAVRVIGTFELVYRSGFTTYWWAMLMPVNFFLNLTGFVVYRFRETRAMTLGQFLEIRYSRRLRIFAGMLMFISGVLNMGIFPAVGARFFIYFCGLPESVRIAGMNVSTLSIAMAALIGVALYLTLGGQVTLLLTDFFEGITTNVAFLAILAFLFYAFDWRTITQSLLSAPAGQSMLNPFEAQGTPDFNLWFMVITVLTNIYSTMAWQGNQGFNCAPASAHEGRMGKIWGHWREMSFSVMLLLLPICAYTVLHHPAFSAPAEEIRSGLAQIPNEQVQVQMTVPMALRQILPQGLKGILCAILFCGFVGNLDTYLHSWGSIFVQDVVLPFRKTPLTSASHIRLLRWSIFGVAAFIFLFSLLYQPTEFILMFQIGTGAIYLAGAGAMIIGGLYWKRGTAQGAWAAMIVGALVMLCSIAIRQLEAALEMPLLKQPNLQIVSAIDMAISLATYVLVSSLTCRQAFNLQRMLHRGIYADSKPTADAVASPRPRRSLLRWVGVNDEFSRSDRLLSTASLLWCACWFAIALVVTIYWSWARISDGAWTRFWQSYCWIGAIIGAATTVWIAWGGLKDLKYMLHRLRTAERNHLDDGRVVAEDNGKEIAGDAQELRLQPEGAVDLKRAAVERNSLV